MLVERRSVNGIVLIFSVCEVDSDAMALKVKQEFTTKERARKAVKAESKPAVKADAHKNGLPEGRPRRVAALLSGSLSKRTERDLRQYARAAGD